MSIATSLLPEFDHEMKVTRTLLERVPDDRADWKPHPKSYSVGDLATHIANLGYWMILSIRESEIDVDPPGGLDRPQFGSTAANLERFDRNVTEARQLLQNMSDDAMRESWTLLNAGRRMMSLPRAAVLRSFVMSHMIHHRGQLSVYLRLLDIPVPEVYGQTADSNR